MNPGGSVKDRAARAIIDDAERSGRLLAGRHGRRRHGRQHRHRARARLQRARLSLRHRDAGQPVAREVPDDRDARRRGAAREDRAVQRSESLPEGGAAGSREEIARRDLGQSVRQHREPRHARAARPGPEIWEQTDGRIDAFVTATGTGGTLGGVSRFLKRQTNIAAASRSRCSPTRRAARSITGCATASSRRPGPGSITEGIGIGRVTANLEGAPLDDALHVDRRRVRAHGLSAAARRRPVPRQHQRRERRRGACRSRKRLGPGHTIVTILCDTGAKYQSRLFNRKWLAEKGLLEAAGLDQPSRRISFRPCLSRRSPRVVDGYPQRLRA